MLKELTNAKTYIVCGYTDMRHSIDGLAAIVKQNYGLEPCSGSLFLFCGKRRVYAVARTAPARSIDRTLPEKNRTVLY